MVNSNSLRNGIPVSTSLTSSLEPEKIQSKVPNDKKQILKISILGVLIGSVVSVIAKFLIYLINLFTNISFYGNLSLQNVSPANNSLGLWVIIIPVIGGIVVGLMAFYGSKAIRGHGIPEAMEQILTNQSRIHPSITYLKPLSAAISIGTGGPFGAEGPIISTGGAIGSTLGQLLKITHNERKILLAAGAAAGMSAIFGSPVAAIFLAIELLLFEFSPRSIIPVALACITGAAGHYLLFGSYPVFSMPAIEAPGALALAAYSLIGVLIGIISAGATKIVYFIEDSFEKLPVHWMWWPAIGGLAVGIVGYFEPRTLGVGYENITDILSGNLPVQIILSLCLLKFVSWAIALGSGTSGGTLAPLLTIGGATGALLGMLVQHFFPSAEVNLLLAALVGMSAMFAGASRALLTSIIFSLETTSQSHALLPLLSACTASYCISYFLMENTIMTEKIARRGIKTPHSYEPDILEHMTVEQVLVEDSFTISAENSIHDVREWLENHRSSLSNYFVIVNNDGAFKGIVSFIELYDKLSDMNAPVESLIKQNHISVAGNDNLRTAIEIMASQNLDVLPVVSNTKSDIVIGVLSYKSILSAYKYRMGEHEENHPSISLKRRGIKIMLRGQQLITKLKTAK